MKHERTSHLEYVKIGDMHVNPKAQRAYSPSHAEKLAAIFQLEGMGYPCVAKNGDGYWIIDGQHRIGCLKIHGFDDEDTVQCEVYEGLTEKELAELFLERNDTKAVHQFDRFRVALTAERDREVEIDRIVRANDLEIGRHRDAISAVSTLVEIWDRSGPTQLSRVLRIIRDAYGLGAFTRQLMMGINLVLDRYGEQVTEQELTDVLGAQRGGATAIESEAEKVRRATAASALQSMASVIVDTLNRKRSRGQKLAAWWTA